MPPELLHIYVVLCPFHSFDSFLNWQLHEWTLDGIVAVQELRHLQQYFISLHCVWEEAECIVIEFIFKCTYMMYLCLCFNILFWWDVWCATQKIRFREIHDLIKHHHVNAQPGSSARPEVLITVNLHKALQWLVWFSGVTWGFVSWKGD